MSKKDPFNTQKYIHTENGYDKDGNKIEPIIKDGKVINSKELGYYGWDDSPSLSDEDKKRLLKDDEILEYKNPVSKDKFHKGRSSRGVGRPKITKMTNQQVFDKYMDLSFKVGQGGHRILPTRRYGNCFNAIKNIYYDEKDIPKALEMLEKLKPAILDVVKNIKKLKTTNKGKYPTDEDFQKEQLLGLHEIYGWCLMLAAPYSFDDYLMSLEYKRKPKDKFYQPRRKVLLPLVKAMQDLADDKLDELFISQPPRTGKTTLAMMYMTWLIGRDSEKTNLYSAFSDTITSAFYSGMLEIIKDDYTYNWSKIFPNSTIPDGATNAKEETLDVGRKKRYHSLTCRSLYGTLNGACDCNGVLMSDDLIGGIEEALNKDRLVAAWSKVDNNLLPRAKEGAKIIWIGTRWSLVDPAGLRMDLLQNDEQFKNKRFKIVNLPALDENGESNFNYTHGVGFSTDYYHERRASFEKNNDMASWLAQYMGEPVERDGALFTVGDMKFFNGVLPEKEPDRVFMAVDVAFGGGDYLSAPICYQYDDDIYIKDVVFNKGDKRVTQPLLVSKIKEHNVQAAKFEANNGGEGYKEDIDRMLHDDGIKINITSAYAITTKRKEQRIFDKAPEIRDFYFLDNGLRSKEYSNFMTNLYSFKMIGKNKNDDAPDSLSMVAEMVNRGKISAMEVFKRMF